MSGILHLISSGGVFGAESVLLELAGWTKAEGWNVSVGIFHNHHKPNLELSEAAARRGLKVKIFPCSGRYDGGLAGRIRSYIKREGVSVLHSHNYKSNIYGWLACPPGVGWIVTEHGRRQGARLAFYHLINSLVMRKADVIAVVSKESASALGMACSGRNKVEVIDNGVDAGRFKTASPASARRGLGLSPEEIVLGTVGSLTREKGHDCLLKALPSLLENYPGLKCLIVGDGPERKRLVRLSSELGINESVIFTGKRDDIPCLLSALDVFVFPSLREGLPMAVLEAMAAGLPVIASEVGGIPSVVENGVSGLLISAGVPEALAGAVKKVLEDRDSAIRMAEKGKDLVREKFSSKAMARKYHILYRDLAGSGN